MHTEGPTAARANEGKPRLSEVWWFQAALEALVAHAEEGRKKYPDVEVGDRYVPNWTLGNKPDEEYLSAIDRHLARIVRDGELYDVETGTLHAAAIIWNAAVLICCNYDGVSPRAQPVPCRTDDGPAPLQPASVRPGSSQAEG